MLPAPETSSYDPNESASSVDVANRAARKEQLDPRCLESVIAHRVIMKQHLLLGRTERGRNRMKRGIQRVEIAIQLIDRKVAGKHAPTDTEDFDGFEYKRADAIGAPMPVKGSESGNFGHDIRDGCERSHSLPPGADCCFVSIGWHPSMIENDERFRIGLREAGSVSHL